MPLDEYESYAPRVANLLEEGADAATVAEALSDIRSKQMRADRDPPEIEKAARKKDRQAARKIVQWFETGEHPGFENDVGV